MDKQIDPSEANKRSKPTNHTVDQKNGSETVLPSHQWEFKTGPQKRDPVSPPTCPVRSAAARWVVFVAVMFDIFSSQELNSNLKMKKNGAPDGFDVTPRMSSEMLCMFVCSP